jgi:15-cis-phytoene synthase
MSEEKTLQPQAIMNAHAKSFSWASRFLTRGTRRQAAHLYAFARLMDDLVDEPRLGSFVQRLHAFQQYSEAVLGSNMSLEHSFQVGQMLREQGVSQEVIISFLDALQADAQARHLNTLDDVLAFSYGVAGTVGQMMRPLLGAHLSADRFAVALGIAMQLTNIARDVLEDAQRGRCYLPAQWLPANWQLQDLVAGDHTTQTEAFKAIERLLREAEGWYALAEEGFEAIPAANRRAIRVAMALYRGIGRKILSVGQQAYWGQRVHLSKWEKIGVIAQMAWPDRVTQPKQSQSLLPSPRLLSIPGFPA